MLTYADVLFTYRFFAELDSENFADFFSAMLSMFQVLTADNWTDM
jgi:hypothetical protein